MVFNENSSSESDQLEIIFEPLGTSRRRAQPSPSESSSSPESSVDVEESLNFNKNLYLSSQGQDNLSDSGTEDLGLQGVVKRKARLLLTRSERNRRRTRSLANRPNLLRPEPGSEVSTEEKETTPKTEPTHGGHGHNKKKSSSTSSSDVILIVNVS